MSELPDSPSTPLGVKKRVPTRAPAPPDPRTAQQYMARSDDPLNSLLIDQGVKILGDSDDSIPEEVQEFMLQNDFGKKAYQVILKERADETGDGATSLAFVRSWSRQVPSIEHIAKHYGPGKYCFVITYRGTDAETGQQKTKSEKIDFEISARFEQEYLDFTRERKIQLLKKNQERVRDIRLDKQFDEAIDGGPAPVDERVKVKEYISEITGVARDLGLTRQGGGAIEQLAPFLPAIGAAVAGIFKMVSDSQNAASQQTNQMLMLMLGQNNKSTEQLMELMKVQSGQGAGSTAIREFTDMIKDAVDLKEILKGDKVSVADRVFGVIEGVLPQILSIAATSKGQQAFDPRVHMARAFVQNDPTFQQAVHDPAILAEVIRRLDSFYGWAQTDGILQIAGLTRPPECPKKPEEEKPQGERPQTQPEAEDAQIAEEKAA